MKRIVPYFLIALLALSGCSILSNLDEISTLGEYSREKDAQHRLVKTIDDYYDALDKATAEGHISDYKDEVSLAHSFGDPILKKDLKDGAQRWLYRHAVYRLSKDKIYVYFDRDGKLIRWEKLPCPKLF